MSLLSKKILLFGSDHITLQTLKHLYHATPNLSIVCPPYARPRTPLANLHDFLKLNHIPLFYEFSSKAQWEEIYAKLQ